MLIDEINLQFYFYAFLLLCCSVLFQDWIYKQICNSSVPMHPKLPPLIEVYVNSIIVRGAKTDYLNEPITEQEVLDVFKESVFTVRSNHRSDDDQQCLAPQLLILYYMLLYEDCLLVNMKTLGKMYYVWAFGGVATTYVAS